MACPKRGVENGQEALRWESRVRNHDRRPAGPVRAGRNLRIGGRGHRPEHRSIERIRLRRDVLQRGGAGGHSAVRRSGIPGPHAPRQRSARADSESWRRRWWSWRRWWPRWWWWSWWLGTRLLISSSLDG